MTPSTTTQDASQSDAIDLQALQDRAASLIEAAKRAGADAADTVVGASRSVSMEVRHGKLEETDSSANTAFSLRVFVGQKSASISTNGGGDVDALAARAVAMARVSPEDQHAGLAPQDRLAKTVPDLDLYDETVPSVNALQDLALTCEEAALAVPGIAQSSGASAGHTVGATVLATSTGFLGGYRASRFSNAVSVIAGEGDKMQRDYDFDSRRHQMDMRSASEIGKRAGERAAARLNPQTLTPQKMPVIFDPRVARGLVSSLSGALNASSIVRKTSFLRDAMGEQIFPDSIQIIDEPHLLRGASSRPFDGEGLYPKTLALIEDGCVANWLLDGRTASELGLESNARAARSGSSTSPSSTNLTLMAGTMSPEELMASAGTALYVNELIGQGVNLVTGDYSRGASGHLIENGKIGPPINEVTIASDLRTMFASLITANDLDNSFGTNAPTLLVAEMTIGGR
ncbi:MAG: metallopeptidase TldD-related protein [Pseudomonadota bacterium]